MKQPRIAALSMAGALALGLAACGGSSSDDGDAPSAPETSATTQATPASTAAATTPTTPTTASTSDGGLTPPGTHLGFGEQAVVAWVPPSTYSSTGGQKGYRLQLSVDAIEQGTLDDFKNIELDAEQRRSTPYYVKVTIKSLDDVKVGTDDPDITFDAIDDRGQPQGSVTFFGDFPRCNDEQVPKPFTSGKSYESCLTYLMPGGGSIDEVQWKDGPSRANDVTPYYDKPVVWSGS